MKRIVYRVVAVSAVMLVCLVASGRAQESAAKKAPGPAEAVLSQWNDVGNRLVAMAEDWPEAKYTYRPNDKVRTFAQILLHVAGSNYSFMNQVQGKKLGNEENDPSTEVFKSKAQVVEFLKKSVTDGAATIQQAGDAGVLAHLGAWVGYTEHMGEHYGQLVVYYRNNGVVPPESRPKK
jgi:hypothetical protein